MDFDEILHDWSARYAAVREEKSLLSEASKGDNWTFCFPRYPIHIDLVSTTPPKPQHGFWWNFTWLKWTICRCAWRKIFAFLMHLREIIGLLFFSHDTLHTDLVSATPPKSPHGFWWYLTWLKCTICRCAWRKIFTFW